MGATGVPRMGVKSGEGRLRSPQLEEGLPSGPAVLCFQPPEAFLTYRTPIGPASCLAGLVALMLQAGAQAQTTEAPAPAASAAARAEEARAKAEADEAMARARRLAANPMRMILEAGRVRRRAEEPGGVVPVSAAIGSPAAASAEAPAARGVPPPSPAAEALLSSQLASEPVQLAPAPALPAATPGVSLPTTAALPSLPVLAAEIPKPRLIQRVNPEVPARLLAELPPDTLFVADLTILPDGTVGAVEPVPPVPRSVQRYVVQALQQWRFEPLPSERVWRVELQFKME